MSSRLARKIIKEQQEAKQSQQKKNESDDDDQDAKPKGQTSKGFFAMMSDEESSGNDEQQSSGEEESEIKEKEILKEKKKKQEEEEERTRRQKEEEEEEKKKKAKEERMKQKKEKKNKKQQEEENHIEEILKKVQENQSQGVQQEEEEQKVDFCKDKNQNQEELSSVLQILKNKLNYNKEIARYFKGAKLTGGDGDEDGEDHIHNIMRTDKRQLLHMKKKMKQLKPMNLVHDNKVRGVNPEKFTCEFVGENRLGQKMYSFRCTQKYENLQQLYLQEQNQMDPQVIYDFIAQHPFHVDALYNLFEFFRLQGKFKEANSFLEQILFIYEDSFGFEFSQIFDDTQNRYCLSVEDNKYGATLFAALLQFIDLLGKKGCYRAALEYNKVLLKMNPEQDPAGALLCIDYNSLSCKAYDYLIYFIKSFSFELYQNPNFSIQYMPNLIYSAALAKFSKVIHPPQPKNKLNAVEPPAIGTMIDFKEEDFKKAINFSVGHIGQSHNVLIITAILLYPKLVKQLCQVNEFQKMPLGHSLLKNWQNKPLKEILEHPFFLDESQPLYAFLSMQTQQDIDGLNKLFEIYVERSKIVWKDNKTALWIKAAIGFVLNILDKKEQEKKGDENQFSYNEFVEGLCLNAEINILPFSLNRYRVLRKANFSDHIERLDLGNIQDNVNMNAANQVPANFNPINVNQGFFQLLGQSLLPWVNLPNQNQNNNNAQIVPNNVEELLMMGPDNNFQDQDFEDESDSQDEQ